MAADLEDHNVAVAEIEDQSSAVGDPETEEEAFLEEVADI